MGDPERKQKEAPRPEKSEWKDGPRKAGPASAAARGRAAQTLGLGIFLGLLGIALVTLLISVWPAAEEATLQPAPTEAPANGQEPAAAAQAEPTVKVSFLGLAELDVTGGTALLILVALLGALGSFIHAGTSFVEYVGNERLGRSWTWWYVLRVPIGASLALILYVAFRGGLFSTSATSGVVNIYGVGALAALAGLFSKQATNKLEDVFNTLFRVPEGKGDDRLKGSLTHDRPTVTATEPPRLVAGRKTVLIVRGTRLVPTSQVRITRGADGEALEAKTTFVDSTRLSVALEAAELADTGRLEIVIVNPPPGGGASAPLYVEIDPLSANGGGEGGGGGDGGGGAEPEDSPTSGVDTASETGAADPTAATAPDSEAAATEELGATTPSADAGTDTTLPPETEPRT